MTLVTVVVPGYNYSHFLGDALDSVLAQTHQAWECIVVDDGSTDSTPEVAGRYVDRDARFRYIRQENRGPSAARNTGIRAGKGDFFQFLDADDKLAPQKLQIQVRFLEKHQHVDLVYGMATFFRTEEPERELYSLYGHLSRPLLQKVSGNRQALEKLQEFNITPPVAMLMRRTVFDRAGLFNENIRRASVEDWDFWLRCAIAGCEFGYLTDEQTLGFIRTHSTSNSRSLTGMVRGLMEAAETFHQMPAGRQWSQPILPAIYEMASGVAAIERGARRKGIGHLWRATRAARAWLTRLRWAGYTAAAFLLPRRLFFWMVTRPMPERGLELVRRIRKIKA